MTSKAGFPFPQVALERIFGFAGREQNKNNP